MPKLPLQFQHFAGPLLILTLAWLLYGLEPWSQTYLQYDRLQIENGQWWRLLTGHLLHTNFNHLLLNSAGVLLLWALHGYYYQYRPYLLFMLLSALACSLGLYLFSVQLIWYVGLSGVLHGLFAWGAMMDIRQGIQSGWLLLLGLWAKVIYEQWFGPSADVAALIDANVAIDAHLFGAISGTVLALPALFRHFSHKER
ncbi:rhombosortase [Bowmanella pacifica]|uniref:Rhombosortase n=1 Tax=Bowmanella pacifica TaxID=502051 RepID=A0A918DJR5_9ALTE|nr:rhombosortase [Bowmanella pacifica]GGO70838.1 rhombosortase [Bowmanella pacifica]